MKSIKADVYQTAMDLCLDWGEFVKKSHVEVLQRHFSDLSYSAIERLNHECNKAKLFALTICEKGIANEYGAEHIKSLIFSEFPKLSEDNLNRLFEQGMYFARN